MLMYIPKEMFMLLLLVVMGVHPEGDVHLLMLMLLLPDDLLLLQMMSLAACAHRLEGDTQTHRPTTRTHRGYCFLSLCLRLRMYI